MLSKCYKADFLAIFNFPFPYITTTKPPVYLFINLAVVWPQSLCHGPQLMLVTQGCTNTSISQLVWAPWKLDQHFLEHISSYFLFWV